MAVSELMFFHIDVHVSELSYHVLAYISRVFHLPFGDLTVSHVPFDAHGVSGSNEYLLNSQKLTFSTDRSWLKILHNQTVITFKAQNWLYLHHNLPIQFVFFIFSEHFQFSPSQKSWSRGTFCFAVVSMQQKPWKLTYLTSTLNQELNKTLHIQNFRVAEKNAKVLVEKGLRFLCYPLMSSLCMIRWGIMV